MAKSLRASVKKANKKRLRSDVFGPVEAARKDRLSAKLLELASQPTTDTAQREKETSDKGAMEGSKEVSMSEDPLLSESEDGMDIEDMQQVRPTRTKSKPTSTKGRVTKSRRRKAASTAVFSFYGKSSRTGPGIKKSKGKAKK